MRQLLATVFLMVSLAAHGAGVIPTLLTTNEPSGTPGTGKVLVATSARALAWTTSPVISGDVTAARFIGDGSLMTGLAGGGDVTTAQLNWASNVLWSAMLSLALEGSNNVAFRLSVLGTNTTNFSLAIGLAGSNYTATVSNTLASFISGLVTATTNGLFFEITNRLTPLSTAFLQVSNAHVALTNNFVLLSAGSLATSNGLISLSNLFTALTASSLQVSNAHVSLSNLVTALQTGSLAVSNGHISLSNLVTALTAGSLSTSNQLTAMGTAFLQVSNAHQSLSNLFNALQTGSLSVSNAHVAVSNLLVALQTSYLVSSNDLRNLKSIQTNFYAGAGITFVVSDGTNVTIQSVGGTGIATNGGTGLNNFLTNLTTVGTQTNLGSGTSGRIDLGDTNGTVFVSLGSSGLNYSNAVFYLSTNGNGGFTTAIWVTTSNGGTNQFVPLSIGSGLSVDMSGRTLTATATGNYVASTNGFSTNQILDKATLSNQTARAGTFYDGYDTNRISDRSTLSNLTSQGTATFTGTGSNWFNILAIGTAATPEFRVGTTGATNDVPFFGNASGLTNISGQVYGGTSGNIAIAAATTAYYQPNNSLTNVITTDAAGGTRVTVPRAGVLTNLYMTCTAAGAAKTNYVTIFTNGVTTGIQAFAPNSTGASNTTASVRVLAGVELGVQVITQTGGAASKVGWGFEYR